MKKWVVGFMTLALLVGLLGADIGTMSAKTSSVSASFNITYGDMAAAARTPAMKVFLYDEAGNLLSTQKTNAADLSVDIPGPAGEAPKNYAIRVIADDGTIGVRYFSDQEVASAAKASAPQERSLPITMSRNCI